MKNILTHLRTMEQLMTKFTSIFSQISIVGVTEPVVVAPKEIPIITNEDNSLIDEIIESDPNALIVEDHGFISHDEDVILAEAYIAEKLAESEMDDSQENSCFVGGQDIMSDSTMTENEDQASAISSELNQQNVIEISISDLREKNIPVQKYMYFPIKAQDDMMIYENRLRIDDEFKALLLSDLRELKTSYGKNFEFTDILERVIHRDLLHGYNWTGNKGKEPLKCFRLFSDLMKDIVEPDQGPFEEVMARAIALSHRRKNNQTYRKRLKENGHTTKLQEETIEALDEAFDLV